MVYFEQLEVPENLANLFNDTSRAYTTNYCMGHISGLPMTYGFMMVSSLHLFY